MHRWVPAAVAAALLVATPAASHGDGPWRPLDARRVLGRSLGAPSAHPAAAAGRCGLAGRPMPDRVRESRGVVYARARSRALRLDLVVPEGPGPHPLVVLIHGGSWRRGHRSNLRYPMHALAARGYAVATVDYRLSRNRDARFPAAVADVRCAVRWLRAHAGSLGLDPERFAALGFSAGGHLAAMLGTAPEVAALDEPGHCPHHRVSPRVQAVVSFYGPYDLRPGQLVGPGSDGAVARFLGVRASRDPDRAALASPLVHVDGTDAPTLLVHGRRDTIVHVDQARRMVSTLRRAGVPTRYVETTRGLHGFSLFPPGPYQPDATCATLRFLSDTLHHHPPRPAQRVTVHLPGRRRGPGGRPLR